MPVPDFQSLMLPLLRLCGEAGAPTIAEAAERLGDQYGLTAEERAQVLKSGQTRLNNRTQWAAIYLRRAGLLDGRGRGQTRITDRGRALLAEQPASLDLSLLSCERPSRTAGFWPVARRSHRSSAPKARQRRA